ncbi:MAG: hypothetical protein O2782_09460 [bacterium]|nr:hypothetical protein [bacterium]
MSDEYKPVTGTPEKDAAMAIKRMGPELAARVFRPSAYAKALHISAAARLLAYHPWSVDAAERKVARCDNPPD